MNFKKIVLAASIVFLGSTVVVNSNSTAAQAKSYPISKNFAKNLKQGKLPRSKGKVGMTYNAFSKKIGKQINLKKYSGTSYSYYDDFSVRTADNYVDWYTFSSKNKKKAKIISISRMYNYYISEKSFKNYFGKPYKYLYANGRTSPTEFPEVYKTGKYYSTIDNLSYDVDYFKAPYSGNYETAEVGVAIKKIAMIPLYPQDGQWRVIDLVR